MLTDPYDTRLVEQEKACARTVALRVLQGAIKSSDEAFRLALRICAGLPEYEYESGGRKQASRGLGRRKAPVGTRGQGPSGTTGNDRHADESSCAT